MLCVEVLKKVEGRREYEIRNQYTQKSSGSVGDNVYAPGRDRFARSRAGSPCRAAETPGAALRQSLRILRPARLAQSQS